MQRRGRSPSVGIESVAYPRDRDQSLARRIGQPEAGRHVVIRDDHPAEQGRNVDGAAFEIEARIPSPDLNPPPVVAEAIVDGAFNVFQGRGMRKRTEATA